MSKRLCKDCKKDISNLRSKCIRCKNCQKNYRKKRGKTFLDKEEEKKALQLEPLGTTDFNQHRKKDFKKEAAEIKKEMIKLGLR